MAIEPAIPTLEEIDLAGAFGGFAPEDFDLFAQEDFADRMALIRTALKPKLVCLSEAVAPRLGVLVEEPMFPHVAQHLRRTVNAPVETWAAFARDRRAYKASAHFRIAVSQDGVRATVFVEDDAPDKARFADHLARNAEPLARYLAHHPTIHAYDLRAADGEPLRGHALDEDTLRAFAGRLQRVKGQHAAFGIPFDKSHPVLQSGPEFMEAALDAARTLKPLYDCGKPDFDYTYTPEPIFLP